MNPQLMTPRKSAAQLEYTLSFPDPVDLSEEEIELRIGYQGQPPKICKTPQVFEVDGQMRGLRFKLNETDTDLRPAAYRSEIWINFTGFGWVRQSSESFTISPVVERCES